MWISQATRTGREDAPFDRAIDRGIDAAAIRFDVQRVAPDVERETYGGPLLPADCLP
jgi:hypothetical protein